MQSHAAVTVSDLADPFLLVNVKDPRVLQRLLSELEKTWIYGAVETKEEQECMQLDPAYADANADLADANADLADANADLANAGVPPESPSRPAGTADPVGDMDDDRKHGEAGDGDGDMERVEAEQVEAEQVEAERAQREKVEAEEVQREQGEHPSTVGDVRSRGYALFDLRPDGSGSTVIESLGNGSSASGSSLDVPPVADPPLRGMDMGMIQRKYNIKIFPVLRLWLLFSEAELVGEKSDYTMRNTQRITRILEVICTIKDMLENEYRLLAASCPAMHIQIPDECTLMKFSGVDFSKNTPFQNLILFLLRQLYRKGYRRYRECCYEQISNSRGQYTNAWRPVSSIKDFVHSTIRKETNYEQWYNMTVSKDNAKAAIEYLTNCEDIEFRELQMDRHLFSYENGQFDASIPKFSAYDDADSRFSGKASSKFFPHVFDGDSYMAVLQKSHWYDIPTPSFQWILDYQTFPRAVCEWVYVFMGKLFFDLNEKDHWEAIMFCKGKAGTGKSTLGKVARNFYDPSDVAVLSSNIERKFGLENIYTKLLWLCYEMKQNFGLNQADFQSMISGEEVSIAQKFKQAVTTTWKTPGMIMGNEIGNWIDTQGSIIRRLVVLEFVRRVKDADADPQLLKKITQQETPALCAKFTFAYQAAVKEYGEQSIWNQLPPYFIETRHRLECLTNGFIAFLESDILIEGFDKYIQWAKFMELFEVYRSKHNLPKQTVSEDVWKPVFEDKSYSIVTEKRFWDGRMSSAKYVIGIGLRADDDEDCAPPATYNASTRAPGSMQTAVAQAVAASASAGSSSSSSSSSNSSSSSSSLATAMLSQKPALAAVASAAKPAPSPQVAGKKRSREGSHPGSHPGSRQGSHPGSRQGSHQGSRRGSREGSP